MSTPSTGTGGFIERILPAAYPRARWTALEWLVLTIIAIFAVSNFIDPTIARRAEELLLLLSLLSAGIIRREDPDAWLYLVMLGFLVFMVIANWLATNQWGNQYDHFRYSLQYLKIFWFLLAGWWFGGRERGIFFIFGLAVAALFLSIILKGGLISWQHLLHGQRVDFHIKNAEHLGTLYGTVVIGLLAFMPRFFQSKKPPLWRAGMGALWLIVFAVSCLVMFGSQTRQVLVGIAAAAIIVFLFSLRWLGPLSIRKLSLLAVVLGAVIALGQSIDAFESMGTRMSREWNAIEKSHEDLDKAINSTSTRLLLWRTALEAIAQRPLLGYGGAARQIVLSRSDLPPTVREQFGHFHNTYLELGVSYGIGAPLLFLGILGLLAARLISAFRNGFLAADITIFGVAWLAFYAVINVFEAYVDYRTGTYLMFIVGGALYSITIPAQRARRELQRVATPSPQPLPPA